MQAYLLLIHSFPDAVGLLTVLKGCLISAADESEIPQAVDIYNQLIDNAEYVDRLSHLVSILYYQLSLH
jgi:hypothetical protein